MPVTTAILLSYEDAPSPPERTPLRAGPLSLVYENGDLRYITCGGQPILLRLYAAVRDRNWATIPGTIKDERIETHPDSFRITYRSLHQQGNVDFVWEAAIIGNADGTLTFDFEGVARATFLRNRIGFCILHPAECAGTVCTVEHANGATSTAPLPEQIVPDQPVLPFADMRGFTQPLPNGGRATLRFLGDIFEMEDQRNWTDASYKTFCTPLRLPYPVEVPAGTHIWQRVEIRAEGSVEKPTHPRQDEAVSIRLHAGEPKSLPAIGFGLSDEENSRTAVQIEKLRALRPAHLRADLRLDSPTWESQWERAQDEAAALNTALELALLLPAQEPEAALRAAVRLSTQRVPLARCLLLPDTERMLVKPDHARLLAAARETLPFSVPFAAGTNSDFLFANRFPPPMTDGDALVFAINPQVHAFDNASLVETLATQATAVRSAQRLAGGKPVIVSPVTLLPRHNPYATAPQSPEASPPADPRQKTAFGAVWTLGSVKYLAESGASALTFYETVGPRGLLEDDTLFPLYTVFAEIAAFTGGSVLPTVSSDPLRVEALTLTDGTRTICLLANMTPIEQRAAVENEEILLPPFGLMKIDL
jgi:D-apionolactonase